ETVAVAGEVHHLEFGGAENRSISLSARKHDGVQEFLRLQQRTDVQIEIEGMNGKPFRRVRQSVVLAPGVRHAAAESRHALEHRTYSLHPHLRFLPSTLPLPA